MLYVIRDHLRAVLIIAAAAIIVAVGVLFLANRNDAAASGAEAKPAIDRLEVTFVPKAERWDARSSTPAIIRLTGMTDDGEEVDYYHAFEADAEEVVELTPGSYGIAYISPTNADGSMYVVPEAESIGTGTSDDGKIVLAASYMLQAPESVTTDMSAELLSQITEATTFGDSTLSGETGRAVMTAARLNMSGAGAGSEADLAEGGVASPAAGEVAENSGKLNWATANDAPQEADQAAKEKDGAASATETNPGSEPVNRFTGETETSPASPASPEAASVSQPAAQQEQKGARAGGVETWVGPAYSEKPAVKAVWVDDGDGTGHYELKEDGAVRVVEQPGRLR